MDNVIWSVYLNVEQAIIAFEINQIEIKRYSIRLLFLKNSLLYSLKKQSKMMIKTTLLFLATVLIYKKGWSSFFLFFFILQIFY